EGVAKVPNGTRLRLQPVRIALRDRYGGSMPSGWTRWLLERFEFPFQVVYPPELDKGMLRDKFDVLLLVDGAFGVRGGSRAAGDSGDQTTPATRTRGERSIPEEYRGRT